MSSSIPQSQFYALSIYFHICNVRLKHGRHIEFRKLVLAKYDKKTSFATLSISDYYQLLSFLVEDNIAQTKIDLN